MTTVWSDLDLDPGPTTWAPWVPGPQTTEPEPEPWYISDPETGEAEPVSWANWTAYLFDLETDGLPYDLTVELYAFLLATGLIYNLQGSHQRACDSLIESGTL